MPQALPLTDWKETTYINKGKGCFCNDVYLASGRFIRQQSERKDSKRQRKASWLDFEGLEACALQLA